MIGLKLDDRHLSWSLGVRWLQLDPVVQMPEAAKRGHSPIGKFASGRSPLAP